MRITHGRQKFVISNKGPYTDAIMLLVRAAADPAASPDTAATERNDVKVLWRSLRGPHKRFLAKVAEYPAGISQGDLGTKLGLDWKELRGVHNGLARICEGQKIEKPVKTSGYNAENRVYHMLPDVARTVLKLNKKDAG